MIRKTSFKPYAALFSFALILGAQSAHAAIITFEALAAPGQSWTNVADGYTEAGFQFNSSDHQGFSDAFSAWETGSNVYPGSTALFNNYDSSVTILTQVGGGAFDMTSIDLCDTFLDGHNQDVTFTGTRADSSTVTNTMHLTNPNVMTTFAFSGMTDIVDLRWTQKVPYNQFDNIVLAGTVPEPTSLAVLGIGAVALVRRRKK